MQRVFNQEFFRAWSPEMAYVLGFLFADGYIQINSRGSSYVCFYCTDLEIIEKIRTLMGSNHKIGIRLRSKTRKKWKDAYVLQIGSVKVCEELKVLGVIPNKSLVIKFPEVPSQFLGDFVRGYFDGDGCVHIGHYWRKDREEWKWQLVINFTSGSKEFLVGLWTALKPRVKGGHISNKTRGYELVFGQHDSLALFKLMYNNVSAEAFLERKYNTFQKAFGVLGMRW